MGYKRIYKWRGILNIANDKTHPFNQFSIYIFHIHSEYVLFSEEEIR